MRTFSGVLTVLPANGIFVFGSNTQGRHGKGSALFAKEVCGATYGQSRGIQGRAYAICTKDLTIAFHPSIPADVIIAQIKKLYQFAERNTHLDFYVAYGVNPNLNGYTPAEMAMMFSVADFYKFPYNVIFNDKFAELLIF